MEKIMIVNDFFRLKNGNFIIEGTYDSSKFKSKDDLKSHIGNTIIIVKPNGNKKRVEVKSIDVAISLTNLINVAIELSSDFNEASIPRYSIVYV